MFKRCGKCGQEWVTRNSFLADTELKLIGYQVNFEELTLGYFMFNHSCKTTLALKVDLFTTLYDGPVFTERATGSEDCMALCLDETSLSPCPAQCECAYVRQVMQIIRDWPGREGGRQ